MGEFDTADGAGRPVRVFISYAHESDEHQETVRRLWIFLRANGIDARLDLSAADRPQDWPQWMTEEAKAADFVLIAVSPAYKRRAEPGAAADDGRGVQFEAALLRELLYQDRPLWLPRMLPVVLPGMSSQDIPTFLGPTTCAWYGISDITLAGTDALMRVLTNQPLNPAPALGTVPHLPPAPAQAGTGLVQTSTGLRHEVEVSVRVSDGRLVTEVSIAGTALGERTADVPYGMASAWVIPDQNVSALDQRLTDAGRRLATAMFDDQVLEHLVRLVDDSALGTVVTVTFVSDDAAAGLPYELLRLPDGRLLATLPGVRTARRISNVDRPATAPLPGPLKILAAVAAPDETRTTSPPLDVEAEMQAVVDAVGMVEQRGQGEVTILEIGGLDQIAAALKSDQYHVLHLSAHGSPTTIELEDEDGAPVTVMAAELVDRLRAAGRPLPLIVLSSCAGAATGLRGLAATLIHHGADRVIAMQAAVTDTYATRLAAELYGALADNADTTVAAALAHARRKLELERVAAARAGKVALPEYGVATLLASGADPPLRDPSAALEPLSAPTRPPIGGTVRELPIGYLIGRRRELRTALGVLRDRPAALAQWGVNAGVVLTGIGGIGKTAVAGRVISRLRGEGWRIAVHDGRWSPQKLIHQVAEAFADHAQLGGILADPQVPDTDKVNYIGAALQQTRLLLVFDDFEQNLGPGGAGFVDPGFAETFARLCAIAHTGRLLVTCRYPIPDDDTLVGVPVAPLSNSELRRMLLRQPNLRDLGADDRRTLIRTIGGHPRLIEFVDALLRNGRSAVLRDVTAKLRDIARKHNINLTSARTLPEAITNAVLAGSRDVVLDELLTLLSDDERQVLLQAAVSLPATAVGDLAVACHEEPPNLTEVRVVTAAVERLLDLTLLTFVDNGVLVHPWVAEALLPYQGADLNLRHERAARMRLGRINAGLFTYADLSEFARHLAATGHYDDLVAFALRAATSPLGQLTIAALLGEIIPVMPTDHEGYIVVAQQESLALLASGNTTAAYNHYQVLHRIIAEQAAAHPTDVMRQFNLSISHVDIGDLCRGLGDRRLAEQHYRDALEIDLRLANEDNPLLKRHPSVTYTRLGEIAEATGNMVDAGRYYRDALEITLRLANADASSADAQRDLSISYNKLGDLMRATGNNAEAEHHYRDALTIREQLAAADPGNLKIQRHLSLSYGRLAELMVAAGNHTEAERLHRDAFAIYQRLAAADPSSAEAQRDLGISYAKLGDLMMTAGDNTEAIRLHREALIIREQLVLTDSDNPQAHGDLSGSHSRLGDLMAAIGNGTQAEHHYQEALAIDLRLAAADADNGKAQSDLAASHSKLGDLLVATGNGTQAEHHYREAVAIVERLATADPDDAQAHRDLSYSLSRLGDLMATAGDIGEAQRFYQEALDLAAQLATTEPESVQAQRDLSVSHNRLGDAMANAGQPAEAEHHYREALTIRERLAGAHEGNAQAQEDLRYSHQRLAALMRAVGNEAEAEHFERLAGPSASDPATT